MPPPIVIPGSPGAQQEGLLREALQRCVDLDPAVIYSITEEEVTRRVPSSFPMPPSMIYTQLEHIATEAPDARTFLAALHNRAVLSLANERRRHQAQATIQASRPPLAPTNNNQASEPLGSVGEGHTPVTDRSEGEITSSTAQTTLRSPTPRSVSTVRRSLRCQAAPEPDHTQKDSPGQRHIGRERKGTTGRERRRPRTRLPDQKGDTRRDASDLISRMEDARANGSH